MNGFIWNWSGGYGAPAKEPFKTGDKIQYIPDPYSSSSKDQIGIIEEVYEHVYRVRWDDNSVDLLDKPALEAACELLDRPSDFTQSNTPKPCWHDWVEYKGFTRVFEYCRKCDQKKT